MREKEGLRDVSAQQQNPSCGPFKEVGPERPNYEGQLVKVKAYGFIKRKN